MIVRMWHGWTTRADADRFEELLKAEIVPGILARRLDGFHGIELLRRRQPGDEVEFATLMRFSSYDAVMDFAGEDYERAYVPDKARALLKRFDERAGHYEVRW